MINPAMTSRMKIYFRLIDICFTLLLFILAIECDAQDKATALRMSPDVATGCSSSKVFSNIDYITLETTPKILLGKIGEC